MLTQYIRKNDCYKNMLDTLDITLEHLEEILLCFTSQGSQQLSFCQSVLETDQQQFSAGVYRICINICQKEMQEVLNTDIFSTHLSQHVRTPSYCNWQTVE